MQQFCFSPPGMSLHILARYRAQRHDGHDVDHHRDNDREQHARRRLLPAGADKAGGKTVHRPGGSAHGETGYQRAGEYPEQVRPLVEHGAHEHEVQNRHRDIAHQRPDRRAVDIYLPRDEEPVDQYLDKAAHDHRYHRELLLAGGLKNGVFHQHHAHEERRYAHHREKAGAGLVAVRVEDVHDGIGQHRKPHAHRHADDGGDAHGVFADLGGVRMRAARDRA